MQWCSSVRVKYDINYLWNFVSSKLILYEVAKPTLFE